MFRSTIPVLSPFSGLIGVSPGSLAAGGAWTESTRATSDVRPTGYLGQSAIGRRTYLFRLGWCARLGHPIPGFAWKRQATAAVRYL